MKTASDLRSVIQFLAETVARGRLEYRGAGEWGDPFAQLAKGGHWGDFVSNYFACRSCGQLFHLQAETYHGAGGGVKKIEKIEEPLRNDVYRKSETLLLDRRR